ncbi:diiron oxygenase, partial [Phenylobacterium sp.]|uniref:diiron oxygenase n=1 Tax=Phenylobacterium sp. TaxID=1871053 RepID=UPI00271A3CD8
MTILEPGISKPKPDWNVTMNPDDLYKTAMNIAWSFQYDMSGDKVEDLYKRAKQNQWDSDEYLPWDTQVDPSKPLINDRSDIYHQMPFFSKLSKSQQETFTAHSTAQLLSQFLHGEQGALMTAACVTHSVPDATAKLYAATQTMDEARHVEVYARYCDKIAIVYPMSLWLKALIDATLKSDRYEKVMIGMNMIVEGLALGAFNNMYRTTQCELLKKLTFN